MGRLYWPKEPAINSSGSWERKIYEGGIAGEKTLVLLMVDKTTHEEITRWFKMARQTGSYPGMLLEKTTNTVAEIKFTLR